MGKRREEMKGAEGVDGPRKRRAPMKAPIEKSKRSSKAPDTPSGTGPRPGEKTPNFTLPMVGGGELELASFVGKKPVVVFFFPRPGAPNDNQEALDFQRIYADLRKLGVALVAICNDPPPKLERFRHDLGLTYPILHDQGGRVAALFGAFALKSVQGRSYRGILRTTFLIDRQGIVLRAWNRVHVRGHGDAVLAAITNV